MLGHHMKWPRWFKQWLGAGHSPSAHTSGGNVHCPTCPKNRQPKFDRWS